MDNDFRKGSVYIEPYNTNPEKYYLWVGGILVGFLSIGRSKEIYPDGPVVEVHWKGLQAMGYDEFAHLKEGIDQLRRLHMK